ncbi:hypothetical protein VP01_3793g1 [Puccinia sorghi]|uniref:Uncharacterized protein n=1 Tax=Puccinia sorghi TaxID=27349 RepID=A0A0L6UUA6_9BASI|nr:hypothetical protein VP01_3793g1 [Puccinia sorghi]
MLCSICVTIPKAHCTEEEVIILKGEERRDVFLFIRQGWYVITMFYSIGYSQKEGILIVRGGRKEWFSVDILCYSTATLLNQTLHQWRNKFDYVKHVVILCYDIVKPSGNFQGFPQLGYYLQPLDASLTCHHNIWPYVMKTHRQKLDTVALEDLNIGVGESGSRSGSSSKEEKNRIGLQSIFVWVDSGVIEPFDAEWCLVDDSFQSSYPHSQCNPNIKKEYQVHKMVTIADMVCDHFKTKNKFLRMNHIIFLMILHSLLLIIYLEINTSYKKPHPEFDLTFIQEIDVKALASGCHGNIPGDMQSHVGFHSLYCIMHGIFGGSVWTAQQYMRVAERVSQTLFNYSWKNLYFGLGDIAIETAKKLAQLSAVDMQHAPAHTSIKLAQLPAVGMQHAQAKLPSKLHMFAYVDVLAQSLCSLKNRSFLMQAAIQTPPVCMCRCFGTVTAQCLCIKYWLNHSGRKVVVTSKAFLDFLHVNFRHGYLVSSSSSFFRCKSEWSYRTTLVKTSSSNRLGIVYYKHLKKRLIISLKSVVVGSKVMSVVVVSYVYETWGIQWIF